MTKSEGNQFSDDYHQKDRLQKDFSKRRLLGVYTVSEILTVLLRLLQTCSAQLGLHNVDQDFSAIQILREINFGHFEGPKSAILTIWAALNIEFLETFNIFRCEIFPIIKIGVSKISQNWFYTPNCPNPYFIPLNRVTCAILLILLGKIYLLWKMSKICFRVKNV